MEEVSLDRPAHPDEAILWIDGVLYLLDQRVLPSREQFIKLENAPDTARAIQEMVVRGAPAIGITAAYGVVLAAQQHSKVSPTGWIEALRRDMETLSTSRPTAINLFWALEKMAERIERLDFTADPVPALLGLAKQIHRDDFNANHRMGKLGAELITGPTGVITHCNAGSLATGGHGTALGVIRSAWQQGRINHVYADETRPWLQGSRLTSWELMKEGIEHSVIADSAAAARMAAGDIGWVIVGSDRIAANGDVANKIGTYQLAVAARYHGVRVMVAAPMSTVDYAVMSGADIPIETRGGDEVLMCGGSQIGLEDAHAWNPVFDVTPAALVDAIVTEKGVVIEPDAEKMATLRDAP